MQNTKELQGYLLYRVSYNKVTIVHCCVNNSFRGNNIAYNLIQYLKNNTKQYDGIKLSCRNDYGINAFWEKCKFVPIKEKVGRSKKGLPLTVWWFPQNTNDLLSQISDYELKNKTVAVIDTNIFLDIKEEREKESLALNSDWITSEAVLYVTREIYVEINRGSTNDIKEANRKHISNFQLLPFRNEQDFNSVVSGLKKEFKLKNDNDHSDINHLAYAITGGAAYFITRDSYLLNNKTFFIQYGLILLRPSEFITYIDEITQEAKYKPKRLIGTQINSSCITFKNIEQYIHIFLKANEKKNVLQKIIRDAVSFPEKFEVVSITREEKNLALVVYDRTEEGQLTIPIIRALKGTIKSTLIKHLLYKAILTSLKENRTLIKITEKQLDNEFEKLLKDAHFSVANSSWSKRSYKGIKQLNEINAENNEQSNPKVDNNFKNNYQLERQLFPLKIFDLEIPTFIVSIKPQWAEQLFYDKSEEKLSLFEPTYELLLNRENVYYRSARPQILKAPSRVLWYISENKSTKTKGCICACSYIDEVFIGKPKKLFKQFEDLGIYEWSDIAKTAGDKENIMAFIFSDTELFEKNISLKRIETIFSDFERKKFMPLSPIKISQKTFLSIYAEGMKQ